MKLNIFETLADVMVMTAGAMERLERELEDDKLIRQNKCRYCCAQPNDPCHTRGGSLLQGRYHVPRLQDKCVTKRDN